jgi:prolyl-tRNA synthetase
MKLSAAFIPTLKEVPADAVIPSHILMLRTGMVRMLSAGIYSFLPLGYKVLRKISDIIREEMDAIGGQEFHLPALNPIEIWESTGRVEAFGDTLFHIKNREYVLAPTHEEIMAFHAKGTLKSYKELPQIWYQIQTKFRNEARPRSGVIRGRQFLMKDSYSMDSSWENLDKSYALHDEAYRKIFDRCGLKYFIVGASSGAMGGSKSEEFMIKSNAGEDTVAYCESCQYAANLEVAISKIDPLKRLNSSTIKNIKNILLDNLEEWKIEGIAQSLIKDLIKINRNVDLIQAIIDENFDIVITPKGFGNKKFEKLIGKKEKILKIIEGNETFSIRTPNVKSINELCDFLKIDECVTAKSRVYIHNDMPVLVLMSGNDEVNETKLTSLLGGIVRPCHPEELQDITGADAGSIGPLGFKSRIIADNRLKEGNNLVSGANKNDYHIGGIDLKRDVPKIEYFDLRTVETNEGCPRCDGKLEVFKAIELGHIFKLGTKYSDALGVTFLDEHGQAHPIIMGSYGIGVDRVLACYIEQNYDENGLIWDKPLAPFDVHLIGLNMKNETVADACNKLYSKLTEEGFEVLFDDRIDASAGFKFNDADLLGMPLQLVVGERNLKDNMVEVKVRRSGEKNKLSLDDLIVKLKEMSRIG